MTGKLLLAHVASTQGIIAAEKLAGLLHPSRLILTSSRAPPTPNRRWVPLVFPKPRQRKRLHGEDRALSISRANGKALGLGNYSGFVKVIVDAKYGEILGGAMIGESVSELLPELTLARRNELTIEDIYNVHAHPTPSEAIQEAAEERTRAVNTTVKIEGKYVKAALSRLFD